MSLVARDNLPVDDIPTKSAVQPHPSRPEDSPGTAITAPADADPYQLNGILDRFDQAWHAGQFPAIDDYLPPPGHPRRMKVLEDLVHIDLECRLKAGKRIRIEDYLSCHPELTQDTGLLLSLLVRECELRRRREPGLEMEEFIRRFPFLAADLRDQLEGAVRFPPPLPL